MDSRYNNQPPYHYSQHNPGPPQPPWQTDPNRVAGWNDPHQRPHAHQHHDHYQPQYPQPPPAQYYSSSFQSPSGHPSNFPPPPPPPSQYSQGQGGNTGYQAQQYDTSQWGVKYNQGQYQQTQPQQQQQYQGQPQQHSYEEQRPALPPRPGSALASGAPQQAYLQNSSDNWNHSTPTQQHFEGSWGSPQPQYGKPPTPPPRPSAYAAPTQYQSGPTTFEQHPPTHRYDPPAQHDWHAGPQQQHDIQNINQGNAPDYTSIAPVWGQNFHPGDGTISPIEDESRKPSAASRSHTVSPLPHQDIRVGATALGQGQPSDWQHYYDPDFYSGDHDDSEKNSVHSHTYTESPASMNQKLAASSEQKIVPLPITPPFAELNSQSHPNDQQAELQLVRVHTHSPSSSENISKVREDRRPGSTSTVSSFAGLQRTGTIDSVIQAWASPLKVTNAPKQPSDALAKASTSFEPMLVPAEKVDVVDVSSQTDFPPMIKTETKVETKIETKEVEVDPYRDIKDAYSATLRRFADMLRQEATADGDEDKFKIFQGFVIRELRLRSVLYGIEVQQTETYKKSADKQETTQNIDGNAQPKEEEQKHESKPVSRPQTPPILSNLDTRKASTPGSKDDSFVVVNAEDADGEYSPGGRPRVAPSRPNVAKPVNVTQKSEQMQGKSSIGPNQNESHSSPGTNAPILSQDYATPGRISPSLQAPMVVGSEQDEPVQLLPSLVSATLTGPINFQPPRPAYTPFKYNEDSVPTAPVIKLERPTEDYGALRQTQAAESGRMLVHEATAFPKEAAVDRGHTQTPSVGRREHEEAFIGLIRQKSQAIRKVPPSVVEAPLQLRAGTPLSRNTTSPAPTIPPLTKTVKSLRLITPKTVPQSETKAVNPKLQRIISDVAKVKDEFGFIHATVLAWDKANRGIRQKLEAERAARQSENEDRVDQLFHDNEIGYADIGELEAEFKLDEAGKKYQEDKLELESFGRDVFEVVVKKVETDIIELGKFQTLTRDLLDLESGSAGVQIQALVKNATNEKAHASEVMDVMLQIFDKIEIRQQKIAEAHFELERRRKRLELSVLYTNGDTAGVKRLEKDFTSAEIIQILEEARKKNERANKLMDSFDRAVVRGLAENQTWIDDALPKLQLLRDLVLGSEDNAPKNPADRDELLYGTDGVKDLMLESQSAIDYILADSQRLVKLSFSADKVLNEADFGIYLAEERIAGGNAAKFEQLKEAKKGEDEKVNEDFEVRLTGVARGPEEMIALIKEIVGRVGNDRSHRERIEKALEEAKKRNAMEMREMGTLKT